MKAILVLGTGRCGSSAVTGSIQALGAFCGNNMRESNSDNPRGYFEDTNISNINKYILNSVFKMPWYDPSIKIEHIEAAYFCREINELIKYGILRGYGDNKVIAIKDPRISLLLHSYTHALTELGYEIYYVHSHRPIEERVKSLIKTNHNFNEDSGREIIQRYSDILHKSLLQCSENRITVEFNNLIHNTSDAIDDIKSYLPFLNYTDESISKVKEFLSADLKHF